MKKIAVFLLLIAASTQVKAQQLLQLQPNIKLNDSLRYAFKPATPLTPQQLLTQAIKVADNTMTVNSTMPVAKIIGNDKMPVAKPAQNGMNYTMLIKKVEIINPNGRVAKPLMP